MKEGWEYKKLGDICSIADFVSNGSFASLKENVKYYNSPNYAVLVRLADASNGFDKSKFVYTDEHGYNFSKKSHLYGGELIMSNVGSVGSMFICPMMNQPMTLAPNTISILSQNNKFLYYYFLSDGFKVKLNGITSSTTLKKFNKTNFKLLEIAIPSLSEQQSIVDYLDSAFAKIDAMKANAEKALNEAKALFQASLKEMLEPKEGWEEKILKEICRVINGRAYSKDEMLKQGKYRLLRVGNFFTNDNWYYSDLELEEDKYCDNGDLLYAWSASFGPRIWDGEKVIYHYHIWKMVCSAEIDKYFMCYWLDSDELKKQTMTNLHGATMAHITKGIIEAANVSFPSLSEQQSIVGTLDSLKFKVDRLQKNYDKISQECDALKQAILRKVFE